MGVDTSRRFRRQVPDPGSVAGPPPAAGWQTAAVAGVLQSLADRLGAGGRPRRPSVAERQLGDPVQAWVLLASPALWLLWMPGVAGLIDRPGPPRRGARYRVSLRLPAGRLGLRAASEGHVQVDVLEPGSAFAWTLIAGQRTERYDVRLDGANATCTSTGGAAAASVLVELDRQSAPL
jgi:hypothetical protein